MCSLNVIRPQSAASLKSWFQKDAPPSGPSGRLASVPTTQPAAPGYPSLGLEYGGAPLAALVPQGGLPQSGWVLLFPTSSPKCITSGAPR